MKRLVYSLTGALLLAVLLAVSAAMAVELGGGGGDVVVGQALPAGTNNVGDVDVEIIGTAATVATEAAAKTADFDLVAATANLRLMHWSCRESAATAVSATVILRHDTVAATCDGPVFAYVELAANGSTGDQYGPRGLAAASGICGDVLAGTVDCSVSTVTEASP